ncbi:response regulator transcription factor [Paenibacillus sp. 481]|uniref:response regulator transcription factor n=1 Tax=Paenibacillus sp. 481 TaxID=2835869 RepID=UPI001E5161B2|nr:response regulator transcription factor [Paenibacillus sp. 481]UHA75100.1 response regulator transcription factor [Paenibacillus sp. 481]
MKTVLVVDDEAKIREVIVSYLHRAGYRTAEAGTGLEAIHIIEQQNMNMVVLDLMLPDLSGEEVCRSVRKLSSVPIIMLTAKSSASSKINGLTLGADDYIVKPFDPNELVARIRTVLRRTEGESLLADRMSFDNDALTLDAVQHKVYVHQSEIGLTPNEYKLLLVMARHPQRMFTREELIEKVLGFDYVGDERTIDQHIKNLRQKVEADPKKPRYIVTVFGKGYRFQGS